MKTITLLSTALMSISIAAFATKEVGNGGNVVFCNSGRISIEMLDYYEARILRGMNVDVDKAGDPINIANQVVRRLLVASPLRRIAYEKYVNSFMNEARFVSGVELVTVPDSDHIFLPDNCKIVQIAIQKEPEFPEDGRYVVNKDLWDNMDAASKAGLILHEVIYREAIDFGAEDSKASRYLNALLAANLVKQHTPDTFNALMQKIGFKAYEAYGSMLMHDKDGETNLVLDTSKFFAPVRPEKVKIQDYEFNTKIPGGIFYDKIYTDVKGSFAFQYGDQPLSLTRLILDDRSQIRLMVGVVPLEKIGFSFEDRSYTFFKNARTNRFALLFDQDGSLADVEGSVYVKNSGNLSLPGIVEIPAGYYRNDSSASSVIGFNRSTISRYGFPIKAMYFLRPTKVQTAYGDLFLKAGIDNGGTTSDSVEIFEDGTIKRGSIVGKQVLNGFPDGGQKGTVCPEGINGMSFTSRGTMDFLILVKLDPQRNCYFFWH